MEAQLDPPFVRVGIWFDRGLVDAQPHLPALAAGKLCEEFGDRFVADPTVFTGGEAVKNGLSSCKAMIDYLMRYGFCRHSVIIGVGGGAFLDAAGFATSLFHRGVRFIRLPSTTLAQGDSGVGVKNGINYAGKKNLLGVFAPPVAVINDFELLRSLPPRLIKDGIAEAIKVAVIRDRHFFERIESLAPAIAANDFDAVCEVVRASALLHMQHIASGGDPFERGQGRPLDFGHWLAHRLESDSGFRVRHGEGVGIGICVDSIYAAMKGLIREEEAMRICACVRGCGLPLWDHVLNASDAGGKPAILAGLEDFREHLGGRLSITLPQGLGDKIEVHEIDIQLMIRALERLRGEGEGATPEETMA